MSYEDSETYLNKQIKIEGKTEKFGEDVPIGRDKIKIKMENDVNPSNPWKVKSLQQFRVFKCPECEKKFDTKMQLVGHAMMSHPKARDALPGVLSDQGVEDVHDVEDGEDVEDFHEVHDVKAEDSGYEDTKKVLTPELLVFQHLKNFNYSYKLVEQFCQEVKFSPPEEKKNVVSIQEVLQHYKNVTQESVEKKRKAEDNGDENAEEELRVNKRHKIFLNSTECYSCGKTGHMSRECPDKAKGGRGGDCFNCGKPGHFSRECTGLSCYNCGKVGHFSRECPDKASGMKCYNCGQPGHLSKECTETDGANSKMLCYKCNTIGHMARNCDKPACGKKCYNCGQPGHFFKDCMETGQIWCQ